MRDPSAVAFVRKPSEEICTHYIPFTAPASYTGSKLHVRDVAMKSAGLLEDAKVFLLSEYNKVKYDRKFREVKISDLCKYYHLNTDYLVRLQAKLDKDFTVASKRSQRGRKSTFTPEIETRLRK